MDTFNFPYHFVKTQYPKNSDVISLGGGYDFTSKPNAPTQRTFILTFPGMAYFLNPVDGSLSTSTSPLWNYRVLQLFYEAHQLWDTFIYPHPHLLTNINVRFAQPLADPDGIPNGAGWLNSFEIQLKEQP